MSPAKMMRRIYGFVALWLLAWLAVLTPGLIEIHRQFQNEPDPY